MQLMDKIIASACALCLVAGVALYKHKPNTIKSLPEMQSSIVRLVDMRNGHFFCSGTVITPHLVLTAAHCLAWMAEEDVHEFIVTTADGRAIEKNAVIVNFNERADIGLVGGNFELMPQVKVETDSARIIDAYKHHNLMLCGFPWGGNMLCNKFTYLGLFYAQFQGDAFAWPGMSGGPVFDLDTGKIVGDLQGITADGHIIVNPTTELVHLFH